MPKKVGTTNWRKKRKQDNLKTVFPIVILMV